MAGAQSLPAFLLAVFIFYWSLPLIVLTYAPLNFARFKGLRSDTYLWGQFLKKVFRLKILKYGPNSLHKGPGSVLYLCNHRSWADFFVDVYLTEGRSALMSRWMVFFVFPVFMTYVIIAKGVVLFKRGAIADKAKFNLWLDHKLKTSPVPGLLVYPEGHRSTRATSLPLKRGMLHYAHSRGLPVQLIITKNKEGVISEKRLSVGWGCKLVTGFSQVIESKGTEFEAFFSTLQASWDKLWAEVYAADPAALPELVQEPVLGYDWARDTRLQQAAVAYGSVPVYFGVLLLTYKAVMAITGVAGALVQKALVTGLLGWLAFSVTAAQVEKA